MTVVWPKAAKRRPPTCFLVPSSPLGKYALVIGMSIGIVEFLQGTDGKYALVVGMPIGGVNPEYDTRARPLPKTTRV